MNNIDDFGLEDELGNHVHFSSTFTFCLSTICSNMKGEGGARGGAVEKIDTIFLKEYPEFFSVVRALLVHVLAFYQQAFNDVDRADYLLALQNLLRLLCVCSYDPHLGRLMAEEDIQLTQKQIRSEKAKQRGEELAVEKPSGTLLLPTLCDVLLNIPDNSVCSLLVSNIFRNLSCYSGAGRGASRAEPMAVTLSIDRSWFNILVKAIRFELEQLDNEAHVFSIEQALFVPYQGSKMPPNTYELLIALMNNLMRTSTNICFYNRRCGGGFGGRPLHPRHPAERVLELGRPGARAGHHSFHRVARADDAVVHPGAGAGPE